MLLLKKQQLLTAPAGYKVMEAAIRIKHNICS